MLALTIAVGLLALVLAADLLLTFGLVRKLSQEGGPPTGGVPMVEMSLAGQPVPPFQVTTTADEVLTERDIGEGRWVLAFMSGACDACFKSAEQLAAWSGTGGTPRILAIVADDGPLTGRITERLGPVPTVVSSRDPASVFATFEVIGFPMYVIVADAHVQRAYLEAAGVAPLFENDGAPADHEHAAHA